MDPEFFYLTSLLFGKNNIVEILQRSVYTVQNVLCVILKDVPNLKITPLGLGNQKMYYFQNLETVQDKTKNILNSG